VREFKFFEWLAAARCSSCQGGLSLREKSRRTIARAAAFGLQNRYGSSDDPAAT
jgi:hypothetical protein